MAFSCLCLKELWSTRAEANAIICSRMDCTHFKSLQEWHRLPRSTPWAACAHWRREKLVSRRYLTRFYRLITVRGGRWERRITWSRKCFLISCGCLVSPSCFLQGVHPHGITSRRADTVGSNQASTASGRSLWAGSGRGTRPSRHRGTTPVSRWGTGRRSPTSRPRVWPTALNTTGCTGRVRCNPPTMGIPSRGRFGKTHKERE